LRGNNKEVLKNAVSASTRENLRQSTSRLVAGFLTGF
jgi:hypothetical protein